MKKFKNTFLRLCISNSSYLGLFNFNMIDLYFCGFTEVCNAFDKDTMF